VFLQARIRATARDWRKIAVNRAAAGCLYLRGRLARHRRYLRRRHDRAVVPEGAHRRLVAREGAHPLLDPAVVREDGHPHLDPAAVREGDRRRHGPAAVREDARHRHDRAVVPEEDVRHNRADGRDRAQEVDDSPSVIAGYTKGGRGNNCPNTNRWKTSR
jgi:hypothetical protein